jgi:nitronate monooxygenase
MIRHWRHGHFVECDGAARQHLARSAAARVRVLAAPSAEDKGRVSMPFQTVLCEMLGIEHPVVMGGLTGVGTPELAAAVSNAGGCGFVCAHQSGDPKRCVEWLKQMDELTDKPWGVNLTILREFTQAEGYCNAIIDAQCHIIETAGRNPVRAV